MTGPLEITFKLISHL